MPAPRSLRLTLAPIATRTSSNTPFQSSLLHQQITPSSPTTPRLKSPAFRLPHTVAALSCSSDSKNPHPISYSPSTSTPNLNLPIRPPSPLAWTWRCHLCHTNYRLGTTRRCLLDGHYLCSQPPPPPPRPLSPVSPLSAEKLVPPPRLAERKGYRESSDGKEDRAEKKVAVMTRKMRSKNGKAARRKTGRGPAATTCTTAFDYLAWADWNAWRRELSGPSAVPPPATATTTPRIPGLVAVNKGERIKMRKDCSADCDFPSECRWRCSGAYLEAVREELLEEEEEGLI